MAFAAQLEGFLKQCETLAACEFANGNDKNFGECLTAILLAVEAAADTEMLTSILLLDGKSLRHGAAPRLPAEYCSAVDGIEIGPKAGSCGTNSARRSCNLCDRYRDRSFVGRLARSGPRTWPARMLVNANIG